MNFKQLQERDLGQMYNTDEFGVSAVYYPKVGESYPIDGIFDEPTQAAELGVGVVTTAPTFNVMETALKTIPSNQDEIQIDGKRYRVRDYEPDGVGTADILLSYLKD